MAAKTNTVLTIPEPRRAALSTKPYPVAGPGFVIVEVAVAPVCKEGRIYRDHQFEWHDSPEHLGHEGVGTIVETAPGSRFEVGDRAGLSADLVEAAIGEPIRQGPTFIE